MRAYRIIWTKQPATESIIAAESEEDALDFMYESVGKNNPRYIVYRGSFESQRAFEFDGFARQAAVMGVLGWYDRETGERVGCCVLDPRQALLPSDTEEELHTREYVVAVLQAIVSEDCDGSAKRFSLKYDLDPHTVGDILRGSMEPTPKVISVLGFRRRFLYESIPGGLHEPKKKVAVFLARKGTRFLYHDTFEDTNQSVRVLDDEGEMMISLADVIDFAKEVIKQQTKSNPH